MVQEIKALGFLCFALVLATCFRSANANDLNPDNWTTLRVCADPNSMPLSNIKKEGFENKIAELLAKDLGWKLDYKWFPQRLAFLEIQFGQKTQVRKVGLLVTLQSALRLTQRGRLVRKRITRLHG